MCPTWTRGVLRTHLTPNPSVGAGGACGACGAGAGARAGASGGDGDCCSGNAGGGACTVCQAQQHRQRSESPHVPAEILSREAGCFPQLAFHVKELRIVPRGLPCSILCWSPR